MITTPIPKKPIAIILITVVLLLLFGNQGKYKSCIKACDDNKHRQKVCTAGDPTLIGVPCYEDYKCTGLSNKFPKDPPTAVSFGTCSGRSKNAECLLEVRRHPGDPLYCIKWSTTDCNNICVEKYK